MNRKIAIEKVDSRTAKVTETMTTTKTYNFSLEDLEEQKSNILSRREKIIEKAALQTQELDDKLNEIESLISQIQNFDVESITPSEGNE